MLTLAKFYFRKQNIIKNKENHLKNLKISQFFKKYMPENKTANQCGKDFQNHSGNKQPLQIFDPW